MEEGRDEVANAVPDPNQVSHHQLIDLMKADAARQEPLVAVIATMLEETITRNELNQKKSTLPAFQGRRPPLTASAFVTRVAKYSGASPCCFAVGLIYLERMKKRDPGVCLTLANFQRLFLISVMTAAKYLDDFYYSNKHWAEVGGITTQEINRLELEFLFRIGFNLHMQREEYDWYAEELHARVEEEALKAAQAAAAKPAVVPADEAESALSARTTPSSSHVPAGAAAPARPPAGGGGDVQMDMDQHAGAPAPQHAQGGQQAQQAQQAQHLQQRGGGGNMDWVYC